MMPVGDDADEGFPGVERRPDHAGPAAHERAHRIEEMGERARAGGEPSLRLLVGRFGVAERHQHAARGERADDFGADAVGRKRQHHGAAVGVGDHFDVARLDLANVVRVVRALPRRVEERPFEMDAEHRRKAPSRVAHCRDRRLRLLRRVGHQGRHHADRAVPAMRLGDAGDDVYARAVVHQRAAAAIDLNVDETRRENSAAEIDFAAAAGTIPIRRDACDVDPFDDDGAVVEESARRRRSARRPAPSSDCLRHFVQIARVVRVAAEAARHGLGETIEAVDHRDRRQQRRRGREQASRSLASSPPVSIRTTSAPA